KTNCKDCGFATCLAFAMALAQNKISLDKCPHVTAEAKAALESASQPPIKLVTVGVGAGKLEMGNETVMYRHEQKLYHPTGIGFLIEDTGDDAKVADAITKINALKFERAGQMISADLICVSNSSGDKENFFGCVKKVVSSSKLNIALATRDPSLAAEAVKACKDKRPLLICEDPSTLDVFINIAKENDLPLALPCADIDQAVQFIDKAKKCGVEELVINITSDGISDRIQAYTFIRRMALKKSIRALGYPILAFTVSSLPDMELAEAVSYLDKYASLVVVKNCTKEFILPLLVARQDIYQDPQKPVQVEPKVYEIGKVTDKSPVLITTNFSITYFTVAGEVESSKVPSYIVACDAEGMSVLTAWAADKFTAEKISETLVKTGMAEKVKHNKVIIPGYVSILSGKLEEVSGWKVAVGPKEASGIPNYLKKA
ncbi:MAG: acetyl-CoA decarbonylase/synthase complex subunit gamma, partial [Candidatus Omnitrophica bacterium]|nr:acetyl-CoA decarbonylase/synthase complex subunit gamma [Candidatus Omnitrophota bacterium]